MLAQQAGHTSDARSREPELTTLTGFLLLATIVYVLHTGYGTHRVDPLIVRVEAVQQAAEAAVAETDAAAQAKALAGVREQLGESGEPSTTLFHQARALVNAYGLKDLHNRIEAAEDAPVFVEGEQKARGEKPDVVVRKTAEAYAASLAQVRDALTEARQRLGQAHPATAGLSPLSGTPASTPPAEVRRDERTRLPAVPAENSAYLGRGLFTDYLLPVELAGMLLLVATIGAIAIAQRRPDDERRGAGDLPGRRA
ncbi:MAG: NADH-quinone oxidoreductase subunit J [Gemmataceae bacterium]